MYHRDVAPLTNDGNGVKLLYVYGCVSRSFQHKLPATIRTAISCRENEEEDENLNLL